MTIIIKEIKAMSRLDDSLVYKHSGYNCCQAVLMAFKDKLGLDDEVLAQLGSGFGNGMGCMEGTCGALCGAAAAAGLMNNGIPTTMITKQLLAKFKNDCGSTICKDLKGIGTGKVLCSCDDCVTNATKALVEVMGIE